MLSPIGFVENWRELGDKPVGVATSRTPVQGGDAAQGYHEGQAGQCQFNASRKKDPWCQHLLLPLGALMLSSDP